MPLPDLIEIVPLAQPVRAEITVPGSKSITNRALILAALAEGETTLRGALWSEDTEVMTAALKELGFEISVEADPAESCNRTIRVRGLGGRIPRAGTAERPLELFVGNAGTAARFLAAMVCLGDGVYRLHGVSRMHERPQAALFAALRELGYCVDSTNDKMPALIFGRSSRGDEAPSGQRKAETSESLLTSAATGKKCSVSVAESSQFASALILSAGRGGWQIEVTGANADELPYVEMTRELVKVFPKQGGEFQIEPDASSGSYFWAVGWLLCVPRITSSNSGMGGPVVSIPMGVEIRQDFSFSIPVPRWWGKKKAESLPAASRLRQVQVKAWPSSGWQIDAEFPRLLPIPDAISRESQLGDSIMTLIVAAADRDSARKWVDGGKRIEDKGVLGSPHRFLHLQRLRLQECERVLALRTELTKCGAKVIEEGDTLTVYPSPLHGAEIETYNDHRMAMCFAVLGLKVPGIRLRNPSCVKKTFPNFFQKLAAAPPHGLGATILDARTGQKLSHDDLFAA